MNAKEKAARMNLLLDTYGSLLTPTQQKIMADKYQCDLSLQEISEHFYISRAAALDAIKVASKKLEEYEKKLHFVEKENKILNAVKDKNLKKKIKSIF